jgi:hypothetical protein
MDLAIGILIGMIIMFMIGIHLYFEIKIQIEDLKDFDKWKEWKNRQQ